MTPEEVRQIVREELDRLARYVDATTESEDVEQIMRALSHGVREIPS